MKSLAEMRRWWGLCLPVLLHIASSTCRRFGEELGTHTKVNATSQRWVEIGYLVAFLGLVCVEKPFFFSSLAIF